MINNTINSQYEVKTQARHTFQISADQNLSTLNFVLVCHRKSIQVSWNLSQLTSDLLQKHCCDLADADTFREV